MYWIDIFWVKYGEQGVEVREVGGDSSDQYTNL